MNCVVLGAGLAGLTAALELQRRGCHAIVIEAAPFAGGRASSWTTSDGMVSGTGLHVVADHYVNLLDLLGTVDGTGEIVWWREHCHLHSGRPPMTWRYSPLPAPFHLLYAARLFPVPLKSRLRLLRASLDAARYRQRDLGSLDELPYLSWHDSHGLGNGPMLEIAELAADAATFLPIERASARAVLSWVKYMSRGRSAARIGTWRAPLSRALISPLVKAIEQAGGEVRLRTVAAGIICRDERVRAVVTAESSARRPCYDAGGQPQLCGPEEELTCDAVISALPVQALRHVVDAGLAARAGISDALKLTTVPAVSAVIAFDGPIRPVPPGAPLVTGCAMRDFIDLTSLSGDSQGPSVYQFLMTRPEEWSARTDEEIVDALVRDLRAVFPAASGVSRAKAVVERIGAAMFAGVPGSHRLRPATGTGIRGLFLAGDWVRHDLNASMEGAVLSGRLAAQAVLGGRASVPVLAPGEPLFLRALQAVARPPLPAV
jgi:15-cis-phytoene desaturase